MSALMPPAGPNARPLSRELLGADATILASAALLVAIRAFLPKDPLGGVAGYLPFHMFVETFSIVVSLMIFGVVWNAWSPVRARSLLVLACAMLAIGLVDFGHMLSVSRMPDFVTPSSPQKGITFWLAARLIAAAGFLLAALLPPSPARGRGYRYSVLAAFLAVTAATYWMALFRLDFLPRFFEAGKGLTPDKVAAEYGIIGIQLVALAVLWRRARRAVSAFDIGMYAAVSLSILSEAFFTFYAAAHDLVQVLGHIYKIVAYGFIYRAVFVENVREPFDRLLETQIDLKRQVEARKTAEEATRKLNEELEARVQLRTAELAAVNAELESFSYSVSHDLRVPLRAVDGFSHMLQKKFGNTLGAEGDRLIGVVRDNTHRMGRLIDDILSFSRMGRKEMSPGAIDMAALARSAGEELEPEWAGRDLDLVVGDLPEARGDGAMLRLVWVNLIGNAIKFTRPMPSARIEIGGRAGAAENIYWVKDNGVGFDMGYVSKLFGVFQRLHGLAEFEGTGIGLAIVKRIVARHGGRVWAEGAVNAGASFCFALPDVQSAPRAQEAPAGRELEVTS